MRRSLVRPALALVALLGALSSGGAPPRAEACCTASRADQPVKIAAQEILVVWDPVSKTEHFVRKAQFIGKPRPGQAAAEPAAGFGFLVPSPTRPEVAASKGAAFEALAAASVPRFVQETRWEVSLMPAVAYPFFLTRAKGSRSGSGDTATNSLQVLEETHVAGYDVAVLAASDPKALTDWLAANGYDARPALQEWARPYVEKRWIITAFKYAARQGEVVTDAVRMSFQTDTPLFPYRVPTDLLAPEGLGNLLRTYVVAPGRASGTLGEGTTARPWSAGTVKRAVPLPSAELARLVGAALPAGALTSHGEGAWLTTFDDDTWPGGTDDLTFALDPKGEEYQQVITNYTDRTLPLPLDVILGLGALGLFIRKKMKGPPREGAK